MPMEAAVVIPAPGLSLFALALSVTGSLAARSFLSASICNRIASCGGRGPILPSQSQLRGFAAATLLRGGSGEERQWNESMCESKLLR
jgi:hypothetical protein